MSTTPYIGKLVLVLTSGEGVLAHRLIRFCCEQENKKKAKQISKYFFYNKNEHVFKVL
jgi:hypothetical protein